MKQFEGKKAALHTLGCKVNAYETDSMAALLKDAGFEIVPFSQPADVYVINTCSVTNIADRKSRQMIHQARKRREGAIVVAAGCYVQTALDKTGLAVDADIILGTGKKQDIVGQIARYLSEREGEGSLKLADVADLRTDRSYETLFLPQVEGHTRASVKVQDGCDMYCSYCIIPYARGHVRSRKPEEVIRELEELARHGTCEVVLTGIHLSSYGVDFPDSAGGSWQERSRLIDLIERSAQVEGIDRIRLGSLEPTIVTEEHADRLSKIETLCPHFHLSLQSGSDSVLRRMNRHYTADRYEESVKILRKYFDKPAITTDVIVGFPGETEEEFRETVRYLEKLKLYETHIFRYSRRAGTRADQMEDQLTEAQKAARAQVLEDLNRRNREAYLRSKEGSPAQVLVEELGDAHIPNAARGSQIGTGSSHKAPGGKWYAGYTKDYIRTYVPSDRDIRGEIVSGRLHVESYVSLG